jgi:hypothetical protein
MARNKGRKMKGIEPAQRKLYYLTATSSGNVTVDIDLAKDLSAVNRRLYRQGMQYYVQSVEFMSAGTTNVRVFAYAAGDTWINHNAWKKGFALWRSQQRDVESVMPNLQGKWADFKIELDDNSATAINTLAGDGGTILCDEWNLANFVWDDDGAERSPTFCLLGATDVTSKIGLVQEYAISRNQVLRSPEVPSEASDSIYAKSLGTDEMTDAIVDFVESENDDPPYDKDQYVGGDTVADAPFIQGFAVANAQGSKGVIGGFTAECGLVRLTINASASYDAVNTATDPDTLTEHINDRDVPIAFTVTLAPGPYKGVMASKMGQ